MGLIIDLSGEPRELKAGQFNLDVDIKMQEPAPKQESCPVVAPDVEPKSCNLENRLMNFYTVKLEVIAGQYPDGCQEWIMQKRPELYKDLCRADDRGNEVWKKCLADGATVADFEAAVDAWYSLQLEAVRLYRASLSKLKKRPEVKQNISACFACGSRQWWMSIYNVRICGVCHPPGAERLVKEWINQPGPGSSNDVRE